MNKPTEPKLIIPIDRKDRQSVVIKWGTEAFGTEQATFLPQRGLRLVEEAAEAAQAAGLIRELAHKTIDHVFDREPGELSQEIGGVGVCILALAEAAGLNADAMEVAELQRILSKPIEHFRARNQAKNDAGLLASTEPKAVNVEEGTELNYFNDWNSRTPVHSAELRDVRLATFHRRLAWNAAMAAKSGTEDGVGTRENDKPPSHWKENDGWKRHPQTAQEWNWREDHVGESGKRSEQRLNFACDLADPHAPDQMAMVLRIDLMRIHARMQSAEAFKAIRIRRDAEAKPDLLPLTPVLPQYYARCGYCERKWMASSKDEQCSVCVGVPPEQRGPVAFEPVDAATEIAAQEQSNKDSHPTDEEMKMAVRLCNSSGILVSGVVAEATVAQLIAFKRFHTEGLPNCKHCALKIRETHMGRVRNEWEHLNGQSYCADGKNWAWPEFAHPEIA